jgi:alpha-galactosidase
MSTMPLPSVPAHYAVLHGRHTSLVLEHHADEAPLWRYWGPSLPDEATPGPALRDTRPLPSFMLDFDQPLTVAPTFGVGWFGQSALLAHRGGQAFAQAFTSCTLEWLQPGQALCLHLADATAELALDITLRLDPTTDVLSVQSQLHNRGSQVLDVGWLAAGTLPLPGRCRSVKSYAGHHMHEFLAMSDVLSRSIWRRENRRGRTSQDNWPGAVVTTPGATEHSGLVFGAHLAWSGNSQQSIEWLHDGQYQWQLGEWLAPGELRLAPGQSHTTPELLASCSSAGLDGLSANFHSALRQRLRWPGQAMRPRPVHLNTWEGFYFDLEPTKVMALATAAAQVGVERFVLDDGWFHGRHDDTAALGDWWPDETKFPQGLGPLISHVNQLGMGFGLWVEPEMVNPHSDLHRAHPEWALQLNGRPLITARNQLVLDIARPEAANYLFDKISALLQAHPIEYLKWDMNRDLACAGLADGSAGYHAQVLAAYALMARLRAAHPDVEIESCSGGGGRIDFGVLQHSHRVWASDNIDALSRVDIQRGLLQFFPPEIMGAHVGTVPARTTGRTQSLGFAAAVALPGHFGLEFDLRKLDAAARTELAGWIQLYKQLRGRLHSGRVWRGQAGDGLVWQAHGDDDAADVLLLIYRVRPSDHRYTPPVRLPMLDTTAHYAVSLIEPEGAVRPHGTSAPLFEQWRAPGGATLHGAWLAQAGLPVPRSKAEVAHIVRLKRV